MSATKNTTAGNAPVAAAGGGRGGLWIAILVVTVIGLLDAVYLTYVHYHGFSALACVGAHNGHSSCETVQSSRWSKLDGIPVALLGLIGYVTLLVSLSDQGRAWARARLLRGADRVRFQRVPDLPRGGLDPRVLRVVPRQRHGPDDSGRADRNPVRARRALAGLTRPPASPAQAPARSHFRNR